MPDAPEGLDHVAAAGISIGVPAQGQTAEGPLDFFLTGRLGHAKDIVITGDHGIDGSRFLRGLPMERPR